MAQDVKKHGETHNCKSERDDKNECAAGTSIVSVCVCVWQECGTETIIKIQETNKYVYGYDRYADVCVCVWGLCGRWISSCLAQWP